jgi:molybdate transport system ATP-binding protein
MNADDDRLVYLDQAVIVRAGGEVVFRDLNWTIRAGQTWAIVGPVGSGKSSLAEVVLGRLHLESGEQGWPLLQRLHAGWPSEVIQRVTFKEDSWLFNYSRHYYQQRFNFIEPQDDLTLDAFLRSGTHADNDSILAAAHQLGIASLLSLSLIKLSNGQMRRARIARALLACPELLILDDPFLGLDVAGRAETASILGKLIREGMRIVLITRAEALPEWVTHVLELDQLAVRWQGPRSEFHPEPTATFGFSSPHLSSPIPHLAAVPVIELRNVNVVYGERVILRDVTWTVRASERWAVLGPNGSGKTTLLSLLCGDHPQAYANDIWLFGRKRGTGESIWEIKRNIGLVSPELHLYFTEPLTAIQTAATGFFDVMTLRRTTPEQDARVRELFHSFEIGHLGERPFARLSTGEQRLVLLIRAVVKSPPVLILDEPFQGLDSELAFRLREWLDQGLGGDQTLLFVSHHAEEIPRTVNRRLRLDEGRVIELI